MRHLRFLLMQFNTLIIMLLIFENIVSLSLPWCKRIRFYLDVGRWIVVFIRESSVCGAVMVILFDAVMLVQLRYLSLNAVFLHFYLFIFHCLWIPVCERFPSLAAKPLLVNYVHTLYVQYVWIFAAVDPTYALLWRFVVCQRLIGRSPCKLQDMVTNGGDNLASWLPWQMRARERERRTLSTYSVFGLSCLSQFSSQNNAVACLQKDSSVLLVSVRVIGPLPRISSPPSSFIWVRFSVPIHQSGLRISCENGFDLALAEPDEFEETAVSNSMSSVWMPRDGSSNLNLWHRFPRLVCALTRFLWLQRK